MYDLLGGRSAPREPLRLIAIDDEADWCALLASTARVLGYMLDSASTLEEAVLKIQAAEAQERPYHGAIVDMNFETGKRKIELPRGKEVVQYLKSKYAYMACIMVSGAGVPPETVLDLRDDFDLDYYLRKDYFDIETFDRALQKAIRRSRAVRSGGHYAQRLQLLLRQWQGIALQTNTNLAVVRERQALKGLDVDVATLNEIERYTLELNEVRAHIKELEQQIAALDAN
jgi:ActR/RegA family two-component response regulator